VKIKVWRTTRFNAKRALIVAWLTIITSFIFNFHVNFLGNYVENNGTFDCVYESFASRWIEVRKKLNFNKLKTYLFIKFKVTTYAYSIVPFFLLGISNCILIHAIYIKANTKCNQDKAKRKAISLSVVVLTIAFVFFTAPRAITFGYYMKELLKTPTGIIILASTSCLSTTYHSLNFAVLVLIDRKFFRELKSFVFDLFGKSTRRKVYPGPRITARTIVEQSF
jgi:hypothetical protein